MDSPGNSAKLHNDAMKLAAQKNEYHWLSFSAFDATYFLVEFWCCPY